MLSFSLRTLLAHKLRFTMTTFAVVLGVAFVVGAFVVTDTLRTAVTGLYEGISSSADVTVRAASPLGGGSNVGTSSRGRLPADLQATVAGVDGVAATGTSVAGYAQLLDRQGAPMTTTGAPFLGVNWPGDPRLSPVALVAGEAPDRPGEVAIDRATADAYGFTVHDRTALLGVKGRYDVEIVGIFTFGPSNTLLGARITAMEGAWAAEVLDTGGQVDTIDVRAALGTDPAELAKRIAAVLPPGVEAVTARTVVDEGVEQVSGLLSVFQNALLGFAGVALFVSAFYINNTFSIVLGQRVRELSLLRAIGATGRQVLASVMLEATLVGLLAGLLGVGVGLLIAKVLEAILAAGGFDLPAQPLALEPRTVVAAAAVGLPVTILAALAPARRAARIAPMEGLRAVAASPERTGARRRTVVGAVLAGGGLALGAAGLFVLDETAAVFTCLALGTAGTFIGVALLSPAIAVPVTGALGWPLARLAGLTGRLARSNTMRNAQRTSRTAAALMIGLALVTTAFVVGESMKRSIGDAVEGAVIADYVVSSSGNTGFSPEVANRLRALPEVGAATGVRMDRFRFAGQDNNLLAADPAAAGRVVDLDLEAGRVEDLGPGSILIHTDPARDFGLHVGDTVEVQYASGAPERVRVAGIYRDATFAGNFVVDLATFAARYPTNNLDRFVFVTAAPGADPAAARRSIEQALAPFPQVKVQSREEFGGSQRDQLNQLLVAVNGLLGLALVIALLGIVNTLALSVVERTHEIGLARAVGMTRRQVWATILFEALVVAVFGALLGVGLGLLFGFGVARAMPPSIVTRIGAPVGTLVLVVVVAAVLGVVAALLPARRAARLDVLDAIAVE